MKYVSVDIETTGLDPDKDDIVEFGAVIDDLENPKPVEQLPRFHAYVLPWRVDEKYKDVPVQQQWKHVRYHGDPYALSMHPTIFRRIAKKEEGYNYYDRSYLIRMFKEWLRSNGLTDKVVLAGKNFASFDLQFLNRIDSWYLMENSYRTLDPTALFIQVGKDKVPPSTRTCLERAGYDNKVAHTAVEDAIDVIRLVRHGLLVKESATFDEPEAPKTPEPIADAIITGVSRLKPTPAPFADTPRKTAACSVVVGVKDGKLKPQVIPVGKQCKREGCVSLQTADSVYCSKHHGAFVRTVLHNSPLVKHHG